MGGAYAVFDDDGDTCLVVTTSSAGAAYDAVFGIRCVPEFPSGGITVAQTSGILLRSVTWDADGGISWS